ncbi:MAG: hypothetical protein QM535_01875 [Limnohabitans sp.]|nr:hypothetical protein [Limnohabitans sp.]
MYSNINNKTTVIISTIYFTTALLFLINEILKLHPFLTYLGLLRLFTLIILYLYTSKKKDYIYLGILIFVIISNILFQKKTNAYLVYGTIAYLIYRFLTFILVYKSIENKKALPIAIATSPFLFFYLYLTFLNEKIFSLGFFSLFFNSLIMSFLGGLSLSNYYLYNNNKNVLLLITVILFVMQNLVFLLQKFYSFDGPFEPVSIILNTITLYIFYRYVLLIEYSET